MRTEQRAELLWEGLSDCYAIDGDAAIWTVNAWLGFHTAGCPDVPQLQEKVRQDAQYWVELATPDELAAYYLAAAIKIGKTPMSEKQNKLLLAECFKRIPQENREGFIEWAKKQTTRST